MLEKQVSEAPQLTFHMRVSVTVGLPVDINNSKLQTIMACYAALH